MTYPQPKITLRRRIALLFSGSYEWARFVNEIRTLIMERDAQMERIQVEIGMLKLERDNKIDELQVESDRHVKKSVNLMAANMTIEELRYCLWYTERALAKQEERRIFIDGAPKEWTIEKALAECPPDLDPSRPTDTALELNNGIRARYDWPNIMPPQVSSPFILDREKAADHNEVMAVAEKFNA